MNFPVTILSHLLLPMLATCNGGSETDEKKARHALVQSSNEFSMALYQVLRGTPGNLVMSPISVGSVMTLMWLGSTGETARQIAVGLRLSEDSSQVEEGFKALLSCFESSRTLALEMANKIYIHNGLKIKAPFHQQAAKNFRSDVEVVDFVNGIESARKSINQWVEQVTHGKIQDFLDQDTLKEDTRLVAINAIYFMGGWLKPFDMNYTTIEPFYTSPNRSVKVSMMRQEGYHLYAESLKLGARAVKLHYRGPNETEPETGITKSMVILVPDAVDGLPALEDKLSSLSLANISSHFSDVLTMVTLPKFKIESGVDLSDQLKELGITKIFQAEAELGGITEEPVYLNKLVQKAFIEVNEKGTEAAAVTSGELIYYSGKTVDFTVNHPFLFLVLDETTDAILFMGRVMEP